MTQRRRSLKHSSRWLPLAVALVVVGSCGGDDDERSAATAEVRPFEEVQASDFMFEADPTDPGRASFG